jgi:hypothetical protein
LEEENIPVPPFESKTNDSITDIVVTASEIVDFIQILDLTKASGPDKISHKMFKIASEKNCRTMPLCLQLIKDIGR